MKQSIEWNVDFIELLLIKINHQVFLLKNNYHSKHNTFETKFPERLPSSLSLSENLEMLFYSILN